jgi:predicted RNase H-like nuclease (RuvC/YqgF family)
VDWPTALSTARDICVALGGLITASASIFAVIRGWPILKSRIELSQERDSAQRDLARALAAQTVAQRANESYQQMVEALSAQMTQLKNEIAGLKVTVESTQHKFLVAVRFIYDAFESQRGALHDLPPLPDELQEAVADVAEAM